MPTLLAVILMPLTIAAAYVVGRSWVVRSTALQRLYELYLERRCGFSALASAMRVEGWQYRDRHDPADRCADRQCRRHARRSAIPLTLRAPAGGW